MTTSDARAVAERAIVADEARAVAPPQILLDHGMAAFLDGKDQARVDPGPHIILCNGKLGEAGVMVELGKRGARRCQRPLLAQHGFGQPREDFELDGQRAVGGLGDARLELGQLGRGEAHHVGERLAVDEQLDMRRLAQDGAMQRGDLDEIAEHVVVADLQRFDAGRLGVSRLQAGDDLAAAVAQAPVLIEIGDRRRP